MIWNYAEYINFFKINIIPLFRMCGVILQNGLCYDFPISYVDWIILNFDSRFPLFAPIIDSALRESNNTFIIGTFLCTDE